MEIYRREGEAFSSIEAEFDDKGNLKIRGQDIDEGMKSWVGSLNSCIAENPSLSANILYV
tara:strand:+ start:2759 stop:2938 length:180 start_codon:yes stop_codon:yes gene_type:complete